jgi:hypothetical protein
MSITSFLFNSRYGVTEYIFIILHLFGILLQRHLR